MVKGPERHPVGAHYGLRDWLLQRLTAVVMAAYTLLLAARLLASPPQGYEAWRALFTSGFMRLATALFVVVLLYHAWVGVRDILMDYVKPTGVRLALQAAVGAALVLYLAWAAAILWGR